jgi:hypothetical protein
MIRAIEGGCMESGYRFIARNHPCTAIGGFARAAAPEKKGLVCVKGFLGNGLRHMGNGVLIAYLGWLLAPSEKERNWVTRSKRVQNKSHFSCRLSDWLAGWTVSVTAHTQARLRSDSKVAISHNDELR